LPDGFGVHAVVDEGEESLQQVRLLVGNREFLELLDESLQLLLQALHVETHTQRRHVLVVDLTLTETHTNTGL